MEAATKGFLKIVLKYFFLNLQIIAGDSHCFVIDVDKNLYCWGDNFYGQLGLGNNKIYNQPIKNTFLPSKSIKDMQSKGKFNLCLLNEGKVLYWPFQKSSGKFIYKPIEIPLPPQIIISMISCGNNFAMY